RLAGGTLVNYGTATFSGTSAGGQTAFLSNGAVFENQGTLTVHFVYMGQAPGDTSTVLFRNSGSLVKDTTSASGIDVPFTNSGTVAVQSGVLSLTGPFSNFAGSTLTGGTYVVGGTLQFNGANIVTNAATIVLDGPSARIIDQTGANALAHFASNAA